MARGFFYTSGIDGNDAIVTNYSGLPAVFTVSFWAKWDLHQNSPNDYEALAVLSHNQSQGALTFTFNWDGRGHVIEVGASADPNPAIYITPEGFNYANYDLRQGCFVCTILNLTDSFDVRKGNPKPRTWINGNELTGGNYWQITPGSTALPLSGGTNNWTIGRTRDRYNGSQRFKGSIAEVSLYEGIRPDNDCQQLSTGKTPLNFAVDKLRFYLPLETNTLDWVTNAATTVTGTKQTAHPTVTKPATEPNRPTPPPPPNPVNTRIIYSIGNSLSDTWKSVGSIAETKGKTINYGRQMIPGSPLANIKNNPTSGFVESPYNYYPEAFAGYDFDCVTFQPFTRDLVESSGDGDVATIDYFIGLISARNRTKTRAFIYGQWCTKVNVTTFTSASWELEYTRAYVSQNFDYDRKGYYQALLSAVRIQSQSKLDKTIAIAPAGDCLQEFNRQAGLGQIAGYASAWDLYADDLHLNNVGSYLVACCMFTCFFSNVDPHGATVPNDYGTISDTLKVKIHDIVWNTLKANSDTFVYQTTLPTATIASIQTVTGGSASINAIVTYTDTNPGEKIAANSLSSSDIVVAKGSSALLVTLAGTYTNSAILPVTYTIAAPTGGWTSANNGTYTISLVASKVKNTLNTFVPENTTLGTFVVNVPGVIVDPPIPPVLPTQPIKRSNRYPIRFIDGVSPFEATMTLYDETGYPANLSGVSLIAIARDLTRRMHINFSVAIADQSIVDNRGLIKLSALPVSHKVPNLIPGTYRRGLRMPLVWDIASTGSKLKPIFLPSPVYVEQSPSLDIIEDETGDLPILPVGFSYLIGVDGAILIGNDGSYLIGKDC